MMSEADMLERYRIIQEWRPYVYSRVGQEYAEDVLSDIFIRSVRLDDRRRQGANVGKFVWGIMRITVLEFTSFAGGRGKIERQRTDQLQDKLARILKVEGTFRDPWLTDRISIAITELPAVRRALMGHYLSGENPEEIRSAMGLDKPAYNNHRRRAMDSIRAAALGTRE